MLWYWYHNTFDPVPLTKRNWDEERMKSALAIALSTLVWLPTLTRAQFCPNFQANAVDVTSDFSHVILQSLCSDEGKSPRQTHYHLRQTGDTTVALTLTASEADLIVPLVDTEGLKFDIRDGWDGGAVGAEMQFAAGKLKSLDILGINDQVYVSDEEGSLTTVKQQGLDHLFQWSSVSSGSISYSAAGKGGAAVIDAPNAALKIDIAGDDQDVKIVAVASIEGAINGLRNKLVVVNGDITDLSVQGIDNEVFVTATGGCANVDTVGISNDCTDESTENATLVDLDCTGPSSTFDCVESSDSAALVTMSLAAASCLLIGLVL